MKIFFTFLSALFTFGVHAQLIVQSGAAITTTGNAVVTLQDADLQNDGSISQSGAGKFVFNGTANNYISGSATTPFDTLEIAKTGTGKLLLSQNAIINSAVLFTAGLIDLNTKNIILQSNALLKNETEATHITGINGGGVIISVVAPNNPVGYNSGNLGASISSTQNMGILQIMRTHQPKANPGNASFTGIQRSYLIMPDNNTGLNATLRFYYLDAELNGKDKNTLTLWRSEDGVNWALAGIDNRNTSGNYVEKYGIASFSTWTLTDALTALPITLISYAAICNNNITTIKWKTGTEENGAKFQIERSIDNGSTFVTIATKPALGNGSNNYEYEDDNSPAANRIFYRIKIISPDGNYTYSPIFSGACTDVTMPFSIYPSPAHDVTAVHIAVRQKTPATIKVYNAAGQLLMQVPCKLDIGNNIIALNVNNFAAGMYLVQIVFENKTELKGSFIKQ